MIYNNRSKGFTLIELLVVIAIIGILSAVVLASLNSARQKGNDAAVKSNLDTIRSQAAIYIDQKGNGVYYSETGTTPATSVGTAAACAVAQTLFTDTTVAQAIASADKASGGAGGATPTNVRCGNDGGGAARITQWAIQVPLSAANTYWCVDSSGQGKQEGAVLNGQTCQ
ncbi:type II secretion system GspH family protein [Patescibacteria group bacterium]|nr:type II secretion system GspH family protein [Patescibacteria group bacterium]